MVAAKEEQFKAEHDLNVSEIKDGKENSTNALKVLYESLKNVRFFDFYIF